MAHGSPDWWGGKPTRTIKGVADMGELAVRLGSNDWYDRGGNVILSEDFTSGLGGWYKIIRGGICSVDLDTAPTMSGGYSVRLRPNDVGGEWTGIGRYLTYPVLSKVGAELSFTPVDNLWYISIGVDIFDGTDYHKLDVRYDHTSGTIDVRHSDTNWYTVGTPGVIDDDDYSFVTLKAVGDFVTDDYITVSFNQHLYDASDYDFSTGATTNNWRMRITVMAYVDGGDTITPHVDDIIITQNEE